MKIQYLVTTKVVCPTCNGLGFINGEPCRRCEGSGEEEAYVCSSCGAFEEECTCFRKEDLPVWCSCDPSWGQECPAPEGEVREAIEVLLSYCQRCPYASLAQKVA